MLNVKVNIKKKHNPIKGLNIGYQDGLKELTKLIEDTAKAYAPVKTGYLKSKIFSVLKRKNSYVKAEAPYAIYQEDGTSKMSAANGGSGFMKPAVQFAKTRIIAIFGKNIRSSMRRV